MNQATTPLERALTEKIPDVGVAEWRTEIIARLDGKEWRGKLLHQGSKNPEDIKTAAIGTMRNRVVDSNRAYEKQMADIEYEFVKLERVYNDPKDAPVVIRRLEDTAEMVAEEKKARKTKKPADA
jgi:hypothetical protein